MIKEPIQIPSNQATSNQPADQPDESDELNKLSNIRIFEKSTMKERMKERTDQERRKEGTKEGREGRGWTGRKGRGRKEGTHGQMNECHNTLHAIMDEQTKKEENQSIDKSTNIPAESTKSQASFKKLILSDLHISQPDNTSMLADPFALSFHQWIDRQVFAGPCGICTLE